MTLKRLRGWHRASLSGIRVADRAVVGGFRGEGDSSSPLANCPVWVLGKTAYPGYPAKDVKDALRATFLRLEAIYDELDVRVAAGETPADLYQSVLEHAAWLHGEWVRIHPFVDHNGSTARLMCLAFGLRYGVPFDLPGKPRTQMPAAGLVLDYEIAAENQMLGDDTLMKRVLHGTVSGLTP